MKGKHLFLIALLAACAGCNTAPPDTSAQDQADIRALEDTWLAAVKAKDLNAVMAVYVSGPSMIVFDASPPLQYVGADAYRKDWQGVFTMFPGAIDASISALDITAGGNVAYSHSIQHLAAMGIDGKKFELTVRVTDGYKKVNGHWLIAHEHVSIPVDIATMKGDPAAK
jgi:ketosteroid isomerase-like protein